MPDRVSHQYRPLHSLADEAVQAGDHALAAELRTEATAWSHAAAQRERAIEDARAELHDIQNALNTLIERYPSAFTLEELARQSVPARPLIERLTQLKGRLAILERSAA
jgi:hypothetical protein